LIYLLPPSEVP